MTSLPITVFGGTGFLGSAIVRELVEAGHIVRIAARRPALPAWACREDGIELIRADIRDEASTAAALVGSGGVINAVSLYVPSRRVGFDAIHAQGAERLARLAREADIQRLVHVSGIGVDEASPSAYVRARARGERAVIKAFPKATILRPSVLFGPQDAFLTNLARLVQLPIIPLFGRGDVQLQPVHVVDVARAVERLMGPRPPAWRLYELGGPDRLTYRAILELVMAYLRKERQLVPIPFLVWRGLAALLSPLPNPPLTRDQVILMQQDNITNPDVGSFTALRMFPRSLRESLPACLP
ncbi:complex I NDUFA9 subunit family protein [Pistricoccus aurantiacus]|uniref:complex I NDUFA9 subunit family protein n=1 Tax=Pistricoccus aurantiacus TaxID=1883414 RepID=UPI0036293943